MTTAQTSTTPWIDTLTRLREPAVREAVVVQCSLDWLRPHRLGLRNTIDEMLIDAQLRRGAGLRVTRVLLHNLPAAACEGVTGEEMKRSFAQWGHRLSGSANLLSAPPPRMQRLIIDGAGPGAPIPDMVDVLEEHGQWCDPLLTERILRIVGSPGVTTPLTNYDMDLDGPFSDSDPSIHL